MAWNWRKFSFRESSMPKIKCICQCGCGKEFEIWPSHIKQSRGKYFSRECESRGQSIFQIGENNNHWKGGKIKVTCQCGCGREFEVFPYIIKNGGGKYYNAECRDRGRSKIRGESHPQWKPKIKVVCQCGCGREFEVLQSDIDRGKGKYYSPECQMKDFSKIYTGEKSSAWKGGISFEPYCPKFNEKFKERVRAFFGYRCQMPGCNHIWQPGEKKLAVHHVNFNKNSCCDPSVPRLFVPLCPGKCHAKTNHNREHWEQLFTELIMTKYNGQCYLPKTF